MFRELATTLASRLPKWRREAPKTALSSAQLQQREKMWERVYVAALMTSAALLVLGVPFMGVLLPGVSYLWPTGGALALMGVQGYAVWRSFAAEKQRKALPAEAENAAVAPDVAAPAAAPSGKAPAAAQDFNPAADKAQAAVAPAAAPVVKSQDKPAP